ncbi:MAG: hypothetical protein V5A18_08670 [Haloarculaceae archaeon]
MRRRQWLGGFLLVLVGVLVLLAALGVPVHLLPALASGENPEVSPAEAGFVHVGEGPTRYEATVENLSTCGPTCRNMTATLRHTGRNTTTNVSLDMRLTANGSEVWSGTRSIGRLRPGQTVRWVQSADVGFGGSQTVIENDGYVMVWIEVGHAGGSETLHKRVKVV